MKTTIFCFSGTGNSYYVAQKLAQELGDAKVVLMASVMDIPHLEMTERVGIIFPTYKGFPPLIVKQFIENVFAMQDLLPIKYCFLITTRYIFNGYSLTATELMLQKAGCLSSYSTQVVMPDVYVPLFTIPDEQKIKALYAKADGRIASIARDITDEKFKFSLKPLFSKFAFHRIMPIIHLSSKDTARQFTVSQACTGCGLCYRMCPSTNIVMEEGKPTFGDNCLGCLGCYHRCPTSAIKFTKKVHAGRYPNKRSGYDMEFRN
ncbi:EFR1 family ferrodoxin [uncultured Sphaerochaeta sp.]|uniref:EFR1 family ferrodoxin n=1 Tax=uncultured Sphaerochaeta sp. TaxID=886478 RepID=UPI002A0A6226|nr:EFR1 family ferrodoxin [uncultured Sphaerochaeta sp.]